MDTTTTIGLIGIITGLIAIGISIFNLFYVRRRTKITAEQLEILRKDAEKKRKFEETSKAVRQAIDTIKAHISYFDSFSPLDFSEHDILAHIHDNKLEKLELIISPRFLEIFDEQNKRVIVKKPKDITDIIEGWPSDYGGGGAFYFDCFPDILENPFVDLGDAYGAVRSFYDAHKMLEPYDYVINSFDNKVLEDLKQSIEEMVKLIFKSLMSKHEIAFSACDSSEAILQKLENEMVGKKSVDKLLQKLLEICDQRLAVIQKEAFLRS